MSQIKLSLAFAFALSIAPAAFAQTACGNAAAAAKASCSVQISETPPKSERKTPVGNAGQEQEAILNDALERARAITNACVTAAAACAKSCDAEKASLQSTACGDNACAYPPELYAATESLNGCNSMAKKANAKFAQVKKKLESDGKDSREIGKEMGGGKKGEEDGLPSIGHHPAVPPVTPPPAKPEATNPAASAKTEKTPEQIKQEKREARREQRREERINALAKTFEALTAKSPLNQAMQEQSAGNTAMNQAAAASAVQAAAAAGPVIVTPTTPEDNDAPDLGRAGFNDAAKKNLAARKALAAKMGLRSRSLGSAAPAAFHPASGRSTLNNGSIMGGPANGSFQLSGGGASLDPVVETERPSDLPNFKLGAPSAGGGMAGSAPTKFAGRLIPKPNAVAGKIQNQGTEEQLRRPAAAGEGTAIRAQSADIWQIISVSFRRHCANGRLMDCAEHLPK